MVRCTACLKVIPATPTLLSPTPCARSNHCLSTIQAWQPVLEMLNSASIQVTEAADSLRRYSDSIDMDPARRDWVLERLDSIQTVARKHRLSAGELPALVDRLRREHDELSHAEERGRELEQQVEGAQLEFLKLAKALSNARRKASRSFATSVTDAMRGLGMPGGIFEVALTTLDDATARPWGIDEIDFLISANPGQAALPLARIASGGELSRMSLAIQVIAQRWQHHSDHGLRRG